jgi:RNA polymerase sigma-70 factor (ECF subfamily)
MRESQGPLGIGQEGLTFRDTATFDLLMGSYRRTIEQGFGELEEIDCFLLEELKRGKQYAFTKIYNRYKSQVYRFCLRMLSDEEGAKDVVQEVFAKLYERSGTLKTNSNLSAWLFTVARNRCLNSRRNSRKEAPGYMDELETDNDPQAIAELQDVKDQVARVLGKLSEDYREVLILREWNRLSYGEIAEILNTTTSSVKSKLFKARIKLRDLVKILYGGESHEL